MITQNRIHVIFTCMYAAVYDKFINHKVVITVLPYNSWNHRDYSIIIVIFSKRKIGPSIHCCDQLKLLCTYTFKRSSAFCSCFFCISISFDNLTIFSFFSETSLSSSCTLCCLPNKSVCIFPHMLLTLKVCKKYRYYNFILWWGISHMTGLEIMYIHIN